MRERDLVGRQGRFIVEGETTLRAVLAGRARFALESVLIAPTRLPAIAGALDAHPRPVPIYVASKAVMSVVAGFAIHRGVLAVGLRGVEPDPDALVPPPPSQAILVGLVGLTNHDNVGGLFRNAAAFGVDAVLLDPTTCDPLYRKAIRVSVGAALTVPFARLAPAEALIDLARRQGLVPLALSPRGGEEIAEVVLPERALLLLGTEGAGLPEAMLARIRTLRIGMEPGFDSLNVATAGCIALHRLWCRRRRIIASAACASDVEHTASGPVSL